MARLAPAAARPAFWLAKLTVMRLELGGTATVSASRTAPATASGDGGLAGSQADQTCRSSAVLNSGSASRLSAVAISRAAGRLVMMAAWLVTTDPWICAPRSSGTWPGGGASTGSYSMMPVAV